MSEAPYSTALSAVELTEAWPALSIEERVEGFLVLSRDDAEDFFSRLSSEEALELVLALPERERRARVRLMPLDDLADLIQKTPPEQRSAITTLLDDAGRREVAALLAYAEDAAGGLMNPRFARLRPEWSVDEAVRYLRRMTRQQSETIYYAYVVDSEQALIGVVSFRELLTAPPEKCVRDVMRTELVTVLDEMDQEAVSEVFARHNLLAIPVVDAAGHVKGIVTADDIVDVVKEEATEDMQKIGGMEALDAPYDQTNLREMFKKRVGWLVLLFLGQTVTASVMGFFEHQLRTAAVLTAFIPLILSSGGNSGSQTSTMIVRALALGEVRLRDWLWVVRRELSLGVALGIVLALLGLARIMLWQSAFDSYGQHFLTIGLTVAAGVLGVVVWGTLTGALLPLVLRRLGMDPASASTPFVATLCDVVGLMIYFATATVTLRGTLL